ncbi:Kelch domain protein [Candidatus Koribacter versatilis Ellin345]|uniref:Kelch domain protein n=1 Tax=Koribacter versatilis (strain Ellin345) TaxID=204669 RepID=Q1IKK4_KORVE|nr:Kelch domain protein [Candidatus Koribacter versatilis Ellin345]
MIRLSSWRCFVVLAILCSLSAFANAVIPTPAAITSPASGTTLSSSSVLFQWTASTPGATQYSIYFGSKPGAVDIAFVNAHLATSATVNSLPTDGREIYVTMFSLIGGTYYRSTATYVAMGTPVKSSMLTPTSGSTLAGNSATFNWNAGTGVTMNSLYLGTTRGAHDIYFINTYAHTTTVNTLPANGGTIYARLWSYIDAAWQYADYTYTNPLITVGVNPPTSSVGPRTPINFTSTVTGNANQQVTWSIQEGTSGGTITQTGPSTASYLAPSFVGTYHVIATPAVDPLKAQTATVTVTPPAGFQVSPDSILVAPSTAQQFNAYQDGTQISTVNWSLQEGGVAGTVSSTGLYTAGSTTGTYHLVATNTSTSDTFTSTISVGSSISVAIYPPSLNAPGTLTSGNALFIDSSVTPSGIDPTVTWSVLEGPSGGTITGATYAKVYVPPTTPGTYHIVATSNADTTKSATLAVPVTAAPAIPSFTATTGAPLSLRNRHGAAVLNDGRVLIVGGSNPSDGSANNSAETYSPTTGTFTALTGSLGSSRQQPTVTVLDATHVLIAGGEQDWESAWNTAEVLDLTAGTFAGTTNNMGAARAGHQAVMLTAGPHSGKVFVMSGRQGTLNYDNNLGTTNTTDWYDPAAKTFSAGPVLNIARSWFTATKLQDGTYLLVGGSTGTSTPGFTSVAAAEIYDPVAEHFTLTTGSMPEGRVQHAATLLNNGKVLITGGYNIGVSDSAMLYDPSTQTFTAVPGGMVYPRWSHTSTLLSNGRVLIVGGETDVSNYEYPTAAEVYDPVANSFSAYGSLHNARNEHSASILPDGHVLIVGDFLYQLPAKAEVSP